MERRGPCEVPIAGEFVAFLDRELEGFEVVCVVEFGSHARGEALPGSDHDLLVVVRSPSVAHVSACYPRDEIYDDFVHRWPDVEILGGDLRDELNRLWSSAHGGSRDVWISGPVVDVRWLIHRIALAGDPDLFERVTAGQTWHDPVGFHRDLDGWLHRDQGFDPALVMRNLSRASRQSLDALDEDDGEHDVPWIHPAVAALRTAAARYWLGMTGEALWSRPWVVGITVRERPDAGPLAMRLYDTKCTEAGRAMLRERYATDRKGLALELAKDSAALRDMVGTLLALGESWAVKPDVGPQNLAYLADLMDGPGR